MKQVKRFFTRKKTPFDVESRELREEINSLFHLNLEEVGLWHRYDVEAELEPYLWEKIKKYILSEPNTDEITVLDPDENKWNSYFAIEYLPGQYDQRADSAEQCIQIIAEGKFAKVRYAKCIGLRGNFSEIELAKIKSYLINTVDSREANLERVESLEQNYDIPSDISRYDGLKDWDLEKLKAFYEKQSMAMTFDDLKHCQKYFADRGIDPTETELKVIDTYWSDHCRHTTFNTEISNIAFEKDNYVELKEKAYETYLEQKKKYRKNRPVTLMDLATLAMKELRETGELDNLDKSEEINACSIEIPIEINGKEEQYLLQFKNETHNHPTEIEPFGGAATCLGGAIRDPLSGRAYVYQAMRVTGSSDPRESIEDTMKGKLPQRKITTGAADGYSSYGNQIGLATGEVREYYHDGFKAKRMEVGAVIGIVAKKDVRREEPASGDLVVVLGGATGRDGCGGATGSSKAHDVDSINQSGAEVQKGNPPEERKLQRLFRNAEFTHFIKRSNDFGAGGVSVAIGELSDSMDIDLNKLPKKYEGLNGTELAISESQERMAIVIEAKDLERVIELSKEENLSAVCVAEITDTGLMRMKWRDKWIVELDREFLETNGVMQKTDVIIGAIESESYFKTRVSRDWKTELYDRLEQLNGSSQIELAEKFDSSIGMNTVLNPYGGITQTTKVDGMVARIPILGEKTEKVSYMSHGYDPYLASWSPFHGGLYSGIIATSKLVAMGCDYKTIRLSCQEYFERLRGDEKRWGKPMAALLGAYHFQHNMKLAAIGGKDSMSGSFEEIDVPPTLISFAVGHGDINEVVSPEFKLENSEIWYFKADRDELEDVSYRNLKLFYEEFHQLAKINKIQAAKAIDSTGVLPSLATMSFGNEIGAELESGENNDWFEVAYGSIVFETKIGDISDEFVQKHGLKLLGKTTSEKIIKVADEAVKIHDIKNRWRKPLEDVFKAHDEKSELALDLTSDKKEFRASIIKKVKPRVLIPVFPGTNCEYDISRKFEMAGGDTEILVFRNRSKEELNASIEALADSIKQSQIIAIPGGFSAGDEPEGSGKFIAAIFRHPKLAERLMNHIKEEDGLMIGICNGFQALVKLGLLPYGEIRTLEEDAPTLTFNAINRHVARVSKTKITSVNSPWMANVNIGDIHNIAISHGEGRFFANEEWVKTLKDKGQIITQYVDANGNPQKSGVDNPNGSTEAIEGIISPDGRILGKMGHSERYEEGLLKNIPGNKKQDLFTAGISYYK
jgi:phosphoribosylformylglycinamidine synthase